MDRTDPCSPWTCILGIAGPNRTRSFGGCPDGDRRHILGIYSLLGRSAPDPLEATAKNFIYSVPLVLMVNLYFFGTFRSTSTGMVLAIISGAVTSGIGYVVWYAALPGLTAARAATVQLSVPVIAALGGVILLSEDITPRLLIASVATLGGVAIVLAQRAVKTP